MSHNVRGQAGSIAPTVRPGRPPSMTEVRPVASLVVEGVAVGLLAAAVMIAWMVAP